MIFFSLFFPTLGESWYQPPCVQWDYRWMVPIEAACLCHGWMGERSEGKGQKGPEKGADQQELWRGLVSAGGEILAEPGHCMAMQEGMGCPNKPQTVFTLLMITQEVSTINSINYRQIMFKTCHEPSQYDQFDIGSPSPFLILSWLLSWNIYPLSFFHMSQYLWSLSLWGLTATMKRAQRRSCPSAPWRVWVASLIWGKLWSS